MGSLRLCKGSLGKSTRPHSLCWPSLLGVPDGYFQHQLWWNLEELRVIAIGLEQEGQDVEATSRWFPALLHADLQPDQRMVWGGVVMVRLHALS